MQDISCLVLPIPAHAFFKQAVLQGEIGHHLLQGGGFTTKVLHLAGRRGAGGGGGCPPPTGASPPPETPSPSRNTSRRRCPRAGTAPRCSPRRAVLPAQCGSSLPQSTADVSDAACPSLPVPPAFYPARISVSSSLLAATMNQKSSFHEDPHFVS